MPGAPSSAALVTDLLYWIWQALPAMAFTMLGNVIPMRSMGASCVKLSLDLFACQKKSAPDRVRLGHSMEFLSDLLVKLSTLGITLSTTTENI